MEQLAEQLANIALDIEAIRLSPHEPFTWASGYRMPIYNDNRRLLGSSEHRALIAHSFRSILQSVEPPCEVIAGTATAGIPHSTTLSDLMRLPLIYIRDKAKGHGLQNRIEGILRPGQRVVVIEDLLSTGGSSVSAVEGVREAGGIVEHCLAIFSYGFAECEERFRSASCSCRALLTYDVLLEVALKRGYIGTDGLAELTEWRSDPFGWGEKRGFPRKQ